MKSGVHPDYHRVLFVDASTGDEWVSFSTMTSSDRREVDGHEIPVIRLEITAHSHPFWTGKSRELDAEGRIDRFRRRYAAKGGKKS
jgi:large subunit ribosomal protein L31